MIKTEGESELCRQLGVRYVFLGPDLVSRKRVPYDRPPAIDRFLTLMDDPETYPVLLHCRAGLHRTYVGSVERAERNISIDNVEKLAAARETLAHALPEVTLYGAIARAGLPRNFHPVASAA